MVDDGNNAGSAGACFFPSIVVALGVISPCVSEICRVVI